jgi:hypothetical protein
LHSSEKLRAVRLKLRLPLFIAHFPNRIQTEMQILINPNPANVKNNLAQDANDKYNMENGKWNQIKSSRAISKSCAIPGCPWRLAAMMPCW